MERLGRLVFKPAPAGAAPRQQVAVPPDADDKERAIALVAAPVATLVAFLSVHSLLAHDPLSGRHHVPASDYDTVLVVLLALAGGTAVFALWRKRLFVGMVLALFGLGLFNLHQWGFGVPFIVAGAWYLVRAYRCHQQEAVANPTGWRARVDARQSAQVSRVRASKRYTPPTR